MGGSGGGGGAGAVDYPDYMKTQHGEWMDEIDVLIDTAQGNSPYDQVGGEKPHDPTTELTAMIQALSDFEDWLDDLDLWGGLAGDASEFSTLMYASASQDAIPAFEAGMRDINAVQTSSFVLGKQMILDRVADRVSQFSADHALKIRTALVAERRTLAGYYVEAYRISIVAQKEYADEWIEFEGAAVKWDLELYTYGANMMSSIGGGHAGVGGAAKPNRYQSALGGAMVGASIGASTGNPYIAIGGAIVGGVAGYFA